MSRRDGATLRRPAWWDDQTSAPDPVLTQDQQRERRRQRLSVHYGATFDLAAEVSEIVAPLAREVSRLPQPAALRREVAAVADGVAEVVHVAAGLVAESRAADAHSRRLAADLAVRPRQPDIADDTLTSGSWSTLLVDYAAQVADDLAALLGRALPPDAEGLRGSLSASDRVDDALRLLDRAARDLEHRIPSVQQRQSLPPMSEYNRQQRERIDAERSERVLSRLGVAP